jgi:integrase/recombinase XerD
MPGAKWVEASLGLFGQRTMSLVKPALKVVESAARNLAPTPLEAAYEHFRLDRMGNRVSPATLAHYDAMIKPFLAWAVEQEVRRFEDLKAERLRHYRALVATRRTRAGRTLEGRTVLDSHKALMTFFRWAAAEEYEVDGKILGLKLPRVPEKEATVFHVRELREVLAACNRAVPNEELAVRVLVGTGLRASELCGLATVGPDGLPDLMTDSLMRGRVELRVRWNAGAKGQKSHRIPIAPKLAAVIKRHEARHRPDVQYSNLLTNRLRRPYDRFGIDDIMDRLQKRVGFRVHAHAFRHTFATVATKLGWNLEHLRAAMGHADYKMLQHYVRLATERDLSGRKDWLDFIAANPALELDG